MQQSVLEYLAFAARVLGCASPVYEFGARRNAADASADVRRFFPGLDFVGCDMQPGPGVDRILDLHAVDLPDAVAGTVLCLDRLEHVEYPRRAVAEMHRILKPDGILILSSVMNFPIHAYPDDYWRFTPGGFGSLLRVFPMRHIGWCGVEDFPTTIVGVGWKRGSRIPEAFVKAYDEWFVRMQIATRVAQDRLRQG